MAIGETQDGAEAAVARHVGMFGRAFRLLLTDARCTRGVARIALYFGLALAGINLVNAVHDGLTYSGADLRIRVVGARAMGLGMNPYRLDEVASLPPTLQDPDQPFGGLSRCTYPPSLLLCYLPLAWLPWPLARAVSMVLEWSALLATVALLAGTLRARRLRLIFAITALAGFAGTSLWRLHVERGQYHVFVVLLLALTAAILSRARKDEWLAGVPLGVAVALRPSVGVALLILLLARSRRVVAAAVASASIVVALTLPFGGLRLWGEWQTLVERYEAIFSGAPDPALWAIPESSRLTADGYVPGRLMFANTQNSSALGLATRCARSVGWTTSPAQMRLIARAGIAAAFAALLLLYLVANRRREFSLRFALHYGIVVSIVTDLLAPIRFGYADIQFLLPVAFALPLLLRANAIPMAVVLLLGLATGSISLFASSSLDIARMLLLLLPVLLLYCGTMVRSLARAGETRP